ncbi:MAG: protein-glutamate O-methyltransferase CheR [Pseudomonadota bacterium]
MPYDIAPILNCLHAKHDIDFTGYRISLIERQLTQRFSATSCDNVAEYLHYLQSNPDELDSLLDALTIHVSRFFRDPLTFEYIAHRVLPEVVHRKKELMDPSLRVWSAGCSMGEEPYSAAILIHELLEKEGLNLRVHIFATDIDEKILARAVRAEFPFESISEVKFGLLKKYFMSKEDVFQLKPEIRTAVSFSVYDILDRKTVAPAESVFGSFDIVFCRNLLIYFDAEHQERIFGKLYRSLSQNGFLVLGGTEIPPLRYQMYFKKVNDYCHIYQRA